MKTFTFLWKRLKGNRYLYIIAFLTILLSTLFTLFTPYLIKIMIDWILSGNIGSAPVFVKRAVAMLGGLTYLRKNLWICGVAVIVPTALNGFVMFGCGVLKSKASERIAENLRNDLYEHIQKLPYKELVRIKTGDYIQRCTSDVELIRRFLETQLIEVGRTVTLIAGVLAVMLTQSVPFTLVSIPILPLIFLFSLIFFNLVKDAFQKTDESEGRMMAVLQENLTGVKVVRAFARQRFEIDKFDKSSIEFRDLDLVLTKLVSYFWSISDFLCVLQTGAIIIVGVIWTVHGSLTLGTVLLFMNYEIQLLWPIRQLGQILSNMGKMSISIARLQEIFDLPVEDMHENGLKLNITGEVEFEHLSFSYEDGEKTLDDISFSVKKGQTVALMGQTGSGKTSLINLLAGLYDYQSGHIRLDGVELNQIDKNWLRKHVGIVEQEVFLFSKTIADNIAIAHEHKTQQGIVDAAKIAEIHRDIEAFPDEYQTLVGERGMTLSGGQKQRVAIARTILGQYPILVFDDSLSAVDTETDAAIRSALKARNQETTTFIIAHRVTTLFDADLILVFEKGRIAQAGTHDELIRQPGLYQRVWKIQSDLEAQFDKENKGANWKELNGKDLESEDLEREE